MRGSIFSLIILLIIFGSCKKSSKDYSLSPEEYQEMGIPEANKIWSLNDYSEAFTALMQLKYNKPFALPIKDSKRSSALFSRMISLENMSFLDNEPIPLYEKAQLIKQYLQVQTELIDIYTNFRMKKQYYNRELIDIHIYGMQVTQKMLNLAYEINKSDDPGDMLMQSGFHSIQYLYISGVIDVLKEQAKTSKYFKNDLEVLTDSVTISVMKNKDWMDSTAVNDLKQALEVVVDSTSSDYIKNKYIELSEML